MAPRPVFEHSVGEEARAAGYAGLSVWAAKWRVGAGALPIPLLGLALSVTAFAITTAFAFATAFAFFPLCLQLSLSLSPTRLAVGSFVCDFGE